MLAKTRQKYSQDDALFWVAQIDTLWIQLLTFPSAPTPRSQHLRKHLNNWIMAKPSAGDLWILIRTSTQEWECTVYSWKSFHFPADTSRLTFNEQKITTEKQLPLCSREPQYCTRTPLLCAAVSSVFSWDGKLTWFWVEWPHRTPPISCQLFRLTFSEHMLLVDFWVESLKCMPRALQGSHSPRRWLGFPQ